MVDMEAGREKFKDEELVDSSTGSMLTEQRNGRVGEKNC